MGLNPLIYRLLHPIISLVMPIPGIAMAPLFIVWMGFGDITIISIGALTTIFPVAYNTLIGVQSIDRQLVRAAEIMGANRFAIVTEVYIPWGAVYLFTGVKLGLARCWEIGDGCRAHCGQQLGVGIYDLECCRTSQRKDCIWWYHSARPPLYFYREVAHSFLRKSDHRKMGNDKRLILNGYSYLMDKKRIPVQNKIYKAIQFIIPILLLGLFWEVWVRAGRINGQLLPAPSMILHTFYDLVLIKGTLQNHLLSSLYRLSVGYIFAVVIGIIIGAILGIHRFTRDMFSTMLSLLISVPTIAWVSRSADHNRTGGENSHYSYLFRRGFEIIYSTLSGVRTVNAQQVNAARIMGVTKIDLFLKVILPGSLVSIVPSLRLSISFCWRALVGAEMLCAMVKWGLGKMIFEARFWNGCQNHVCRSHAYRYFHYINGSRTSPETIGTENDCKVGYGWEKLNDAERSLCKDFYKRCK